MINKVKELRQIVPIPMGEALQLLKDNGGDVEKCVEYFKAKSIADISRQTGCKEKMASEFYEMEKYDFNRTISSIREALFDQNYQPIENVTVENIGKAHRWLDLIEDKDFITALEYNHLDDVLSLFSSIDSMKEIADIIARAKKIKDSYFEGYSDNDSMEEFIRRNQLLDNDLEMQNINDSIPVKITLIDKELSRHLRNLYKKENFTQQ